MIFLTDADTDIKMLIPTLYLYRYISVSVKSTGLFLVKRSFGQFVEKMKMKVDSHDEKGHNKLELSGAKLSYKLKCSYD